MLFISQRLKSTFLLYKLKRIKVTGLYISHLLKKNILNQSLDDQIIQNKILVAHSFICGVLLVSESQLGQALGLHGLHQ